MFTVLSDPTIYSYSAWADWDAKRRILLSGYNDEQHSVLLNQIFGVWHLMWVI